MMSKVFFDTNILIYAYDEHSMRKRDACRSLLETAKAKGNGVLSTQVLQEFFVASTGKLGMSPFLSKEALDAFDFMEAVTLDTRLIKAAVDCHILSKVSFWDALIIVAAESARCEILWSEDLNPGQIIRGVRIENPLK